MNLMQLCATTLLLTTMTMTAQAQDPAQDPAAADTFEREALKTLKASHAAKRSVTVSVGGQRVAGMVKAIGPDVIIIGNREHGTILMRRERIDMIETN